MNRTIITEYLKEYKQNFETVNQDEIYKWKAVKHFQDNWDIEKSNFYTMLDKSLNLAGNLLASGQYYPKRMLLKNAKISPLKVRNLFSDLYKEDESIPERIKNFRTDFKKINKENFGDLNDYQDHRAVLVYLTLKFPDRYYFYKFMMFKEFANIVENTYVPVKGRIENTGQFKRLCEHVKYEIKKDQELLKLHKNRIADNCYYDESLNILTQDFIYSVVRHLNISGIEKSTSNLKGSIRDLEYSEIEIVTPKINFTPKNVNFLQNNIENKRLGDQGESWVIELERQRLRKANKPKLAAKVKHVSVEEGDGAGYDILSYKTSGEELFIEVKTTKGNANSTFYISRNELERSKKEPEKYRLYRVYNFNEKNNTADIVILSGNMSKFCEFPVSYKVKYNETPVGNNI